MDVIDIDSKRIRGKVVHAYGDTDFEQEEVASKIAEVNLEDIDKITVARNLKKPDPNIRAKHPAAVARMVFSVILLLLVLGAVF